MKTKFIASLVLASSVCAFANQVATAQPAPAAPQPVQPYVNPQPYQGYYGLPQKAMNTIQKTYPGVYIKDIDFEGYGFEVELTNFMKMYFDRNGNLLGQAWDD